MTNGQETHGIPPAPGEALAGQAAPFDLMRVFRLARKELREILRDRRTVITLIAMPVLLYPLMSVAFQQFALERRVSRVAPEYRIAALTAPESSFFDWRFTEGQLAWLRAQKMTAEQISEWKRFRKPTFAWYGVGSGPLNRDERAAGLDEFDYMLRTGAIDLAISIPDLKPDDNAPPEDRLLECTIYAMPNSSVARHALAEIERAFAATNAENLKKRLGLPGVKRRIAMVSVDRVFLQTSTGDGLITLDALVPLILILMTITGAVYPAIDLTAGEHERGTLEILVATPVPRFELLSAKYISVVTVAVANAIVNLVCMSVTLSWSGLGPVLVVGGMSFALLVRIFALLLLFAFFFSAVLLCLTSLARSFKEAQAYLIPLMLASLAPGIMAMMPGLKLSGMLKVLPLVNIVLMARDLFSTGTDLVTTLTVILTTLLYALAALALAARVFGAESVLYSEQSSWSDLLRRPEEPQPVAAIPAALWCLALMLPIQFALLAVLRLLAPGPSASIFWQIAITILLFGILPAFFLYLGRVELSTGLGLAVPRPGAVLGALLLGASLWPLELWLLMKSSLSSMLHERFSNVLESLQTARIEIGWGVLAVVIVPAILEEFYFRGMLFQALRLRCSAWLTVGISALLFGLAHVVLGGAVGLDRLLPSMLLGLILSIVCWYAGSLWPSMIQHVCHNVLLMIVGLTYADEMEAVPWSWLAASVCVAGIGAFIMCVWGGRRAPAYQATAAPPGTLPQSPR